MSAKKEIQKFYFLSALSFLLDPDLKQIIQESGYRKSSRSNRIRIHKTAFQTNNTVTITIGWLFHQLYLSSSPHSFYLSISYVFLVLPPFPLFCFCFSVCGRGPLRPQIATKYPRLLIWQASLKAASTLTVGRLKYSARLKQIAFVMFEVYT